jgi:uncharacterized membrane protein
VEPSERAPDDAADAASVQRDVDRLVAFSDGVFAIAITLLVLNIQVPDVSDKNLGDAVADLVPEIFTYALSFVVVGLYWISHYQMFRALQRVDRTLLWLNLAMLAFVALLPFPTELLGEYGDTSLATVIYASAIVAVGSTSALVWWYINHAGLSAPARAGAVRMGLLRITIAPAVFALSIPIALVEPDVAKLTWLLIWPANVVLERRHAKAASTT